MFVIECHECEKQFSFVFHVFDKALALAKSFSFIQHICLLLNWENED